MTSYYQALVCFLARAYYEGPWPRPDFVQEAREYFSCTT